MKLSVLIIARYGLYHEDDVVVASIEFLSVLIIARYGLYHLCKR